MRAAFGGKTILLHRNLFHQWGSYCSLAEAGNNYFLATVRSAFDTAAHVPFLRDVASLLDLGEADLTRRDILFPAFILLHLYLYSIAYDSADVVVGLTEIAADESARQRAERELSGLMGCNVDLADARLELEAASSTFHAPHMLRDTIEQLAKLIPGSSISNEASLFVDQARQQRPGRVGAFRVLHSSHAHRPSPAGSRRPEARLGAETARLADVSADNDRLLDDLSAVVRDLRGEPSLQADPTNRVPVVAELMTEGRGIREALRAATAAKDASLHRISDAEHALADARAQVDVIVAERDAALARGCETTAELDAALANVAATAADRDAAFASVAQMASARDASPCLCSRNGGET